MKENRRHIDIKKVISVLFFIVLLVYGYQAYKYKKEKSFSAFHITISKEGHERRLISKKSVMNMIRKELGFDPSVASIDQIDFWNLENALKNNPYIDKVRIYVDANLAVHVEVAQRKPIARVISENVDYYVDIEGVKIPPTNLSTVRVPIVSGNVDFLKRNTKENKKYYAAMVQLFDRVQNDEFMKALVDQIVIEADRSLVFIPKIGQEKLIFGPLENVDEKFAKLKGFYRYGIKEKGWNKYAYLDLSYKGQVAAGKR